MVNLLVSPTFLLNCLTRTISIACWLSKAGPRSTGSRPGAEGAGWGAVQGTAGVSLPTRSR